MKLHDFIQVIPNVLDYKFCSDLINKENIYEKAEVVINSKGHINTKIRNCSTSGIFQEDDKVIFQAIGKCIKEYSKIKFITMPDHELNDCGYELLKYEKGEFYTQHTDEVTINPRKISISLCLNEDYEGGEFQFFSDYKVVGKTGDAIVFPSNFCFPHEILPVKSNTRYSLITWVY